MTSINTTVTRISKKTLAEVRVIAKQRGKNVTFILDDMLRVYQLLNGVWDGKEVNDADKKSVAT